MNIKDLHKLFLESQGVSTDTRKVSNGQLFFALTGENFNGNEYAEQALEKGASYAVIDQEEFAKSDKFIVVDDVLQTLQQLATYHRNQLKVPLLAITGSNGKTTSKELIHAVLNKKFRTTATKGNLNNHIGVPLTLLSLDESTEFAIVEMGANHHGEIAKLSEIANPDYGYITNFGKAHLEGFGSVEGVIKAKSELYSFLKENNKMLFLNADDPIQQKQLSYSHTFSFGQSATAGVQVEYPKATQPTEVIFRGKTYKSQLTGSYNAANIAAALCIGHYFGVEEAAMQEAVESYIPSNNRSQILKIGSTTLLMDAYNANPTSMMAALESFHTFPAERKIAILGDLLELGSVSQQEHQNMVAYAAGLDLEQALLVGNNFSKTSLPDKRFSKFDTFPGLKEKLLETDFSNAHVLIKGSRGMALERVAELLKNKSGEEQKHRS